MTVMFSAVPLGVGGQFQPHDKRAVLGRIARRHGQLHAFRQSRRRRAPSGIVRTLEHIGMTVFGEERRYAGDEQRGRDRCETHDAARVNASSQHLAPP